MIAWVFPVIDIGVVESVYVVAGKSIVAVRLKVDLDKVQLGAASIKFSNQARASKLSGHKWWPERQQIDLLFDFLEVPPQPGDAAFVSMSS